MVVIRKVIMFLCGCHQEGGSVPAWLSSDKVILFSVDVIKNQIPLLCGCNQENGSEPVWFSSGR